MNHATETLPYNTGWREQGIEYKSPEYWAYLQDRAGKK